MRIDLICMIENRQSIFDAYTGFNDMNDTTIKTMGKELPFLKTPCRCLEKAIYL